ncbi:Type 1 glutamine amidotransferase-like domain-containing protein [Antrihabitans sp. YC2-6]|uniref:Type 1 glutamine amidotransferase-like domain-containing protein n=1 Tax=Antrihabitans sp. YC2-6 TaxID=2799498 RepID=UPI0018F70990|nr:Type 1 glutamine amidotransferase-like domain-containing protein [Antrihabitans sp. YC2-6]MBJ8348089.1 Type 1 glutamine amidotransferase-like domain-containing protein [Antrihabitans sp. YC2-6]
MRLFLSSYRFGAHQERLLQLLGDRPRSAAVIANAADAWPPSARASAVVSDLTPLRRLGFTAREVDLRDYVDHADRLAATLADHSLVWVRGGNSFVLRAQFARSGADSVLPDLLSRDVLAYAGYSAGACVLTPSLRGLETLDDPGEVLPTCGVDPIWDGLGLVHKPIVPHWRSPMSDSDEIDVVVADFRSRGVDIWALTDEQAVVVDGESIVVH